MSLGCQLSSTLSFDISPPGLSHEPFAQLAEAELSAYYRSMVDRYSVAIAEIAAERWLSTFACSDVNRENPRRSLRHITIRAIADMASREFAPENIYASTEKRRNR